MDLAARVGKVKVGQTSTEATLSLVLESTCSACHSGDRSKPQKICAH